ncbi:MAG TPA: rhomboid family intramembrane serine protease [Thermoanaerobaculia bacterium]|nr:rhomboid family intramembrane serine protease [Thermoanaerobaculia bacterium]
MTTALLVTIAGVFLLQRTLGMDYVVDRGGNTGAVFQTGQYWRLLTAMFLHGNVLHWLVNSWSLYQLGSLYETMFGSKRFAAVYFITGLCASVASVIHLPADGVSVGASGAIFGILGAFIFSIRRSPRWRHEPWARSLMGQLVFWAIANIALGMQFAVIDNWAHIGGLIAGLVVGLLPHRVPPPPPNQWVIDVRPQGGQSGGDPAARIDGH